LRIHPQLSAAGVKVRLWLDGQCQVKLTAFFLY